MNGRGFDEHDYGAIKDNKGQSRLRHLDIDNGSALQERITDRHSRYSFRPTHLDCERSSSTVIAVFATVTDAVSVKSFG